MGHSIMCNLGTTRGLYSVALASPASALPSTSSSEHSPVPFLTSRRVTTKGRSPRLGKDTQCVRYYITQDLLRSPDTAGLGKRRENRLFAVGSYSKPMLRRLPRYCTQCSALPEFALEGADLSIHCISCFSGIVQFTLELPAGRVGSLGLLFCFLKLPFQLLQAHVRLVRLRTGRDRDQCSLTYSTVAKRTVSQVSPS